MRLIIEPDYALASEWVANYVAKSINEFGPTKAKPFVLGLPTGSSPQKRDGFIRKCYHLQYG